MSGDFRPGSGPILVIAEMSGPRGRANARLVLNTGASGSLLHPEILRSADYDPAASTDLARITTGTGSATVPRLMFNRLSALGRHAIGLRVLAHALTAGAGVDGLLGLDFFRGLAPTIDFRAGRIDLA